MPCPEVLTWSFQAALKADKLPPTQHHTPAECQNLGQLLLGASLPESAYPAQARRLGRSSAELRTQPGDEKYTGSMENLVL